MFITPSRVAGAAFVPRSVAADPNADAAHAAFRSARDQFGILLEYTTVNNTKYNVSNLDECATLLSDAVNGAAPFVRADSRQAYIERFQSRLDSFAGAYADLRDVEQAAKEYQKWRRVPGSYAYGRRIALQERMYSGIEDARSVYKLAVKDIDWAVKLLPPAGKVTPPKPGTAAA